jgi:hypothetical protein
MTAHQKELSSSERKTVLSVLETLKAHECIISFRIENEDVRVEWATHGFAYAFEELKTNLRPLGLKKKSERGWLMLLLAQKDKKAVDEWTFASFRQKRGL